MSIYESLLHTDHDQVRLRICHLRRLYVQQLICKQCTIQMRRRSKRGQDTRAADPVKYVQLTLKTLQYHARLWNCLAYIYNNPLKYESVVTVRELYYCLPEFASPRQVSEILKDICQILNIQRHQLFIEGSPKGQVFGELVVVQSDGVCVDCSSQPQLITSGMVQEVEMHSSAQMIIVIEKEAIFSRLAAQQLHRRMQALLITGKGVPCLLTKRFVKDLQAKLQLPAYGLFDYNPFGASIFLNYRIGAQFGTWDSVLYTSDIHYIGLFWTDILRLQLSESSCLKPLTARDISVARGILQIPFVLERPEYSQAVVDMIESNVKADLESLNEIEFDFVATFIQSKLLTIHSSGRIRGIYQI